MSTNIRVLPGIAIFYDVDGTPVPIISDGYGPAELDPLFVAGDPTDPRIDTIYVEMVDFAAGAWQVGVAHGVPETTPQPPGVSFPQVAVVELTVPAGATSWDDCLAPASPNAGHDARHVFHPQGLFNGTTWALTNRVDIEGADIGMHSTDAQSATFDFYHVGGQNILVAHADPTDAAADTVSVFDGLLARGALPTIDPTAIADADLQAVVVMLIALGAVLDGS